MCLCCVSHGQLVTEGYQTISLGFKELLKVGQHQSPVGGTQMNWPTFATWASNSVGMNIRNQTLQVLVKEHLHDLPSWLQALIDAMGPDWVQRLPFIDKLFAQMGTGLCAGNIWVFHEIGAKFSLFGASFANQTQRDDAALQRYLATFNRDQKDLAQAMANYYEAMWMTHPGQEEQRAQYIAWANALVGLQEQTELQPFIISAFPPPLNVTILGHTYLVDFNALFSKMITLVMATEWVAPTHDLPPRPSDGALWSKFLVHPSLPGYASVYTSLVQNAGGPGFDSTVGTGAHNWGHLDERMRFIVPAMRSRQDDPTLDCAVFSPANMALINAGQVPKEADLCFANCCQHNGMRSL